jgi:hypothetical protein
MGRIITVTLAVAACSVGIAAAAHASSGEKVLLCHGTASDSNPYVLISVSENSLPGHLDGPSSGDGKNRRPDFLLEPGRSDCSGGPHYER